MNIISFKLLFKSIYMYHAGAQFEDYLGKILALGAKISPDIGLREKWESP